MPINMDTNQSIIQIEGSASSKFTIHLVSWNDASSGKKIIHRASWGRFWNVEKKIVYVYPNPAKNVEFVKFNLPYDAKYIEIYNIAGEFVNEIKVLDVFNTRWYLDNYYYKPVSSGIYIFVVKTDKGKIYKNKIAVIK